MRCDGLAVCLENFRQSFAGARAAKVSLRYSRFVVPLWQKPEMQEAMNLMMTEGQEGLEQAMASDPELRAIAEKLNGFM